MSNFELYVTSGTPSIGISLVDDAVFLDAYDDGGQLAALVESRDPQLRAWATDQYEDWRTDSRRIPAATVTFPH